MTVKVTFAVRYPEYTSRIFKNVTPKKLESIVSTLKSQMAEGLIEDYQTEVLK